MDPDYIHALEEVTKVSFFKGQMALEADMMRSFQAKLQTIALLQSDKTALDYAYWRGKIDGLKALRALRESYTKKEG